MRYRCSTHAACSPAPASPRQAATAVIGQRLKQSGMRWTVTGAEMVSLAAAILLYIGVAVTHFA